jgi:hypothetical protein
MGYQTYVQEKAKIMKVGVLGSGDVAKALTDGFAKHGHHVVMGTRDPSKLKDWGGQHRIDRVGSFADAANFGELVVLAVKGHCGARRAAGGRYGERGGQACHRCNEPDRRLASRQRRAEILHQS